MSETTTAREALARAIYEGSEAYTGAHDLTRVEWENNYVRREWLAAADAALAWLATLADDDALVERYRRAWGSGDRAPRDATDARLDLSALVAALNDEGAPRSCRLCGAEVYECEAKHADGGRWLHCRQSPTHNFPADN